MSGLLDCYPPIAVRDELQSLNWMARLPPEPSDRGFEGSGVGVAQRSRRVQPRTDRRSRLAIVLVVRVRIGEDGWLSTLKRLGAELRPDLFAEF